jgi:hypothetical protein
LEKNILKSLRLFSFLGLFGFFFKKFLVKPLASRFVRELRYYCADRFYTGFPMLGCHPTSGKCFWVLWVSIHLYPKSEVGNCSPTRFLPDFYRIFV